jgi:hypothetical protein
MCLKLVLSKTTNSWISSIPPLLATAFLILNFFMMMEAVAYPDGIHETPEIKMMQECRNLAAVFLDKEEILSS